MENTITLSGLSIYTIKSKRVIVIKMSGYIDIYNSNDFMNFVGKEIEENKHYDYFLFDFKNINYVSSTGVGAIMKLYNDLDFKNKKMELFNVSKSVKDVIDLLGFSSFLRFNSSSINEYKENIESN